MDNPDAAEQEDQWIRDNIKIYYKKIFLFNNYKIFYY